MHVGKKEMWWYVSMDFEVYYVSDFNHIKEQSIFIHQFQHLLWQLCKNPNKTFYGPSLNKTLMPSPVVNNTPSNHYFLIGIVLLNPLIGHFWNLGASIHWQQQHQTKRSTLSGSALRFYASLKLHKVLLIHAETINFTVSACVVVFRKRLLFVSNCKAVVLD